MTPRDRTYPKATEPIPMSEPDEDQCDPGDEHPDDDETDEELRLDIIAWERSRW